MRRLIVGVVGGDEEEGSDAASSVGAAIARAGLIACTGGHSDGGNQVKSAALRGALQADPDARTIGFLPAGSPRRPSASPYQLYEYTNLPSTMRNSFTGLTPDAVVVFPGSRGTLVEMAFAQARGSPLRLWRSHQFLCERRQFHTTSRDDRGTVLDQMQDAREVLAPRLASRYSIDALVGALDHVLEHDSDFDGSPDDLISALVGSLGRLATRSHTGYPGRVDDASCKRTFEISVQRISN
jgi:SLOG cluster4 family